MLDGVTTRVLNITQGHRVGVKGRPVARYVGKPEKNTRHARSTPHPHAFYIALLNHRI